MKKLVFFAIASLFLFSIAYSLSEFTIYETEPITIQPQAFDPDGDNLSINYSPPLDSNGFWQTTYGDAGIYNVTIKVSDSLDVSVENIILTVLKKEEPPVITKVNPDSDVLDIKEGDTVNFIVEASDLNKDVLNYSWYLNGKLSSTTKEIRFKPGFDDSGYYYLKVEITDGASTVSREWSLNVLDVDRPAEFFSIEPQRAKENEMIEINLSAIDRDGDVVFFSADNMPKGAIIDGNRIIWTPDFDAVKQESFADRILRGFHILAKTFPINVYAHSRQLNSSQTILITISDVNRQPVFSQVNEITVKEGESFEIVPNATDPDGDKLSYKFSGWVNSNIYQTSFQDEGMHIVLVTATDGEFYVSKNLTVNVVNVNQKPVIKPIKVIEVKEGEEAMISVDASDPDFDDLSFSLDEDSVNNGMVVKLETIKWIPDFDTVRNSSDSPKEIKFKVTAYDGEFSAEQESGIKVVNVNREPEIRKTNPDKFFFAYPNKVITFEVSAEDLDKDKLQYTWNTGFMQTYKGAPKLKMKFSSLGKKEVSVVVSDGEIKKEFIWNVHVINQPKKPKTISIK